MTDQSNTQPAEKPKPRSSFWRIVLMVVGGFVAIIAAIVTLAFWATSGIVESTDEFFTKLQNNDSKGAYELSATGFQKATTLKAFDSFIANYKLTDYTSASWSSRETSGVGNGATGSLDGTLTWKDGTTRPVKVELIKEGDKWHVYSVEFEPAGAKTSEDTSKAAGKIPTERDLVELVHKSDIVFSKAIDADSMEAFHKHISNLWAKQHSVEKLNGFFATFMERDANLLPLADLTPVFKEPASIDKDGVLIVTGYYDSTPSRAAFRHKYIFEGSGWKLVGYKMDLEPVETGNNDGANKF